jgi:hypothetical protein
MVQFWLNAIDIDLKEKLEIRIGIITGRSRLARVRCTAKPTFERLAPVINMAQKMEYNGLAMEVNISMATYERISGSKFIIKEGGEVQITNGKVNAHLVTKEETFLFECSLGDRESE